jgi:hypothetical protein
MNLLSGAGDGERGESLAKGSSTAQASLTASASRVLTPLLL